MTTDLSPAGSTASKEPSTGIGSFYRAHRPESLAAIGAAVAILAYYKSKHPSAASTASTASANIDTSTGYPTGSAADQAALAQQSGAGASNPYATTPYSSSPGDQGSTGYSGSGFGGGGGSGADIQSQLSAITTTLTGDQTLLQGLTQPGPNNMPLTNGMIPGIPPNPTPGSPSVGPAPAPARHGAASALAMTDTNLAKDRAAVKAHPTAKNRAAVKALTARQGKLGGR